MIHKLNPTQKIIPVVKADAYGHDAAWTVSQLLDLPSLHGFGVATLEEGAALRISLGERGRTLRFIVFSGCAPWNDEKGHFCKQYNLTPVIASAADWNIFFKKGWPRLLPYELKFNTGMNRLGIEQQMASKIISQLRTKPAIYRPQSILSHLATAEDPLSTWSKRQLQNFKIVRNEFKAAFPEIMCHLANSAAIWNSKSWKLDQLTDAVRPGLSLYGILPWNDAPDPGLKPVLCLKAKVVTVVTLKAGDGLGYGAKYVHPRTAPPMKVAILGAGYADGIHRSLSTGGQVWMKGQLRPFLGRISMDLCAVSCPSSVKPGDQAEFIGPHINPWVQAEAAGTIPYELLTSVSTSHSSRIQRIYV